MFQLAFSLLTLVTLIGGRAFADGGTVQMSEERGPYRITVFSTSAVVRAGPEDISVLIQDRKTNQPLLNGEVRLSLRRADEKSAAPNEVWVPPCCRMKSSGGLDKIEATHEVATNKLLYAATVTLPEAGEWEIKVAVKASGSEATISGKLRVSPPAPPVLAYWPFFLLPIVSIAAYVLHSNLPKL
ncbi:MAG: hypothetical protein C5B47_04055 [Verrucomicrobia bacterium]|nr:MAG: hypothetical protein C5B47_04055 [Verrucomicrobiota bacterium]